MRIHYILLFRVEFLNALLYSLKDYREIWISSDHISSELRSSWMFHEPSEDNTEKISISSEKWWICNLTAELLTKILINNGPKTFPCSTPLVTFCNDEYKFTLTCYGLFFRKYQIQPTGNCFMVHLVRWKCLCWATRSDVKEKVWAKDWYLNLIFTYYIFQGCWMLIIRMCSVLLDLPKWNLAFHT